MNSAAAIKFKLEEPKAYFSHAQSIALLQAALAGDLAKASHLVSSGADPNEEGPQEPNANRLRLLHYAIASNNKPAVEILFKVGADPELVAKGNGRAYLFAVTLNNAEMLSLLLDLRPVSALSEKTLRLLMFESVIQGRTSCLELLLRRGVPVDLPDASGYTVFMRALDAQNFDLAESLLNLGASVNIETPGGMTPAYQLQRMLSRYETGTKTYVQLQRMQKLMVARGITFPARDPQAILGAKTQKTQ
jgi:ankyrin repeat protein